MRNPLAPLIGAALLIVMGFLLWREHERVQFLEAQLAAAQSRRLQALRPLPERGGTADRGNAIQGELTKPANQPASPATPVMPRAFTEPERKFRGQVNQQHRWQALTKRANLIRDLKLAPEKLNPLKELLVERDYVERDARDAARGTGLNPNDAAASETAKVDARIRTLLGEPDYARYAELVALEDYRQMLSGTPIFGSMVDAGAPLTDEQKNWFAQICYRALGPQSARLGLDPAAVHNVFRDMLLSQAPGNLTALQLEALQEYFRKEDELDAQMKLLMRERPPPK